MRRTVPERERRRGARLVGAADDVAAEPLLAEEPPDRQAVLPPQAAARDRGSDSHRVPLAVDLDQPRVHPATVRACPSAAGAIRPRPRGGFGC
jgi:hypothetical protein